WSPGRSAGMSGRGVCMARASKFVSLRLLWSALVFLLVCGPLAFGQSQITASISGTVLDSSGQSVAQARVTIFNAERAITREFTTDASGFFSFTFLPPATYVVEVEAQGFKHYKQEGVSLAAGQT